MKNCVNILRARGIVINKINVLNSDYVNLKLEVHAANLVHYFEVTFDFNDKEILFFDSVDSPDDLEEGDIMISAGHELFKNNIPIIGHICKTLLDQFLVRRFN